MTCYFRRANMKKAFPSLIALVATLICLSVARAGDVTVKVRMTMGPEDDSTTTFATDTPKLYAMFKTEGAKTGDKIRGVWIADNVGDAAPKGYKIDERTFTAEGDTSDGEFSLSKPDGWPVGQYHIEIYVNDELATKMKFTIKAAKKKSADEEEEESSGD
jgi:hypothetical protein